MIEVSEPMDDVVHKGVSFGAKHQVIRHTHRNSLWQEQIKRKQTVHGTNATDVKIHVNAAIWIKHGEEQRRVRYMADGDSFWLLGWIRVGSPCR